MTKLSPVKTVIRFQDKMTNRCSGVFGT